MKSELPLSSNTSHHNPITNDRKLRVIISYSIFLAIILITVALTDYDTPLVFQGECIIRRHDGECVVTSFSPFDEVEYGEYIDKVDSYGKHVHTKPELPKEINCSTRTPDRTLYGGYVCYYTKGEIIFEIVNTPFDEILYHVIACIIFMITAILGVFGMFIFMDKLEA